MDLHEREMPSAHYQHPLTFSVLLVGVQLLSLLVQVESEILAELEGSRWYIYVPIAQNSPPDRVFSLAVPLKSAAYN